MNNINSKLTKIYTGLATLGVGYSLMYGIASISQQCDPMIRDDCVAEGWTLLITGLAVGYSVAKITAPIFSNAVEELEKLVLTDN